MTSLPLRIGIIMGSTRPGRLNGAVSSWVAQLAVERIDAEFVLIDIARYRLPLLDEPLPASSNQYIHPHTRAWSNTIAACDGFVFVTPEYNHGIPASLKNAIDYLFAEWNDKAAGFVSYGAAGGIRATEHLRLVMGALAVADVRSQVLFSLFTDFEDFSTFRPAPHHQTNLHRMLDDLIAWSSALRTLRWQSSRVGAVTIDSDADRSAQVQ
jgi:NAD(P)H-dependent FMN reductase